MQILLIILLIFQSSKANQFNKLIVFDDAHLYGNAGVYLEPAGQYLSYSGSIQIPFVYMLPSIEFLHTSNCPTHSTIIQNHRNILEHIKMITSFNPIRPKRSFLPIISVLTGGLSIWNTVEIQNIKYKVNQLRTESQVIDKAIHNIVESQNLMITKVGEITVLLGDHAKVIKKLVNQTSCLTEAMNEFQFYLTNWLMYAPNEFIAAYSGAITGTVTPELLSAHNLHTVILNHREMSRTIYALEPAIVYELGKVILSEVQVGNYAVLKGIIQLPKILSKSPEPIYTLHRVNIIINDTDTLINLPDLLICPSLSTCREPPFNRCIRKSSRLLCMYGTSQPVNICFNGIINNNTDNCELSIRKHDNPIIIQTQGGILMGGSKKDIKVFTRGDHIDTLSKIINRRNTAFMITHKDGDWISFDDEIYSTQISGFNYNFTIYETINNPSITYDISKLTHKWKSISEVKYDSLNFSNIDSYDGLYILLIIINIILILTVSFLYCHIFKRSKPKINPEMQEFIGLR